MFVLPYAERIPLLYLDINLGERGVPRLMIYDDDEPSAIASKFSINYSLSEGKQLKLEAMITSKMEEHLSRLVEKVHK